MVATAQERLHCLTASVADARAARKLAYKKYIDVKKVICFNNVPARFTSFDGNIFPDVAGIVWRKYRYCLKCEACGYHVTTPAVKFVSFARVSSAIL